MTVMTIITPIIVTMAMAMVAVDVTSVVVTAIMMVVEIDHRRALHGTHVVAHDSSCALE